MVDPGVREPLLMVLTPLTAAGEVAVVLAVLLLLEVSVSGVVVVMFAVLLITEPAAAVELRCTLIVKVAKPLMGRLGMLHITVPLLPESGVLQSNEGPLFCMILKYRTDGGSASLQLTLAAAPELLLLTEIV